MLVSEVYPTLDFSVSMSMPQVYAGGCLTGNRVMVIPKSVERFVRLDRAFFKGEKPECFCTVVEDLGCCKDRRNVLDPVKLAKTDEMIVMAVCPDHGIDMGRSVEEELLPEIR